MEQAEIDAAVKRRVELENKWVGEVVTYVDPHRKSHNSLICACHTFDEHDRPAYVNVVYVSDDPSKRDQYGRQIQREATSVPLKSKVTAAGRHFII